MRIKIAEYFLDVSKLILAGVVLTTILDQDIFSKGLVLFLGLLSTIGFAMLGLNLLRMEELKWKQ